MRRGIAVVVLWLATICTAVAGEGMSRAYLDYINKYKAIAIEHCRLYGIPASISLAQGLLESAAGRSRLAVEANNPFGIKCHGNRDGGCVEEKGDLYRCYSGAVESWNDHARFLKRKRYSRLYTLKTTDYRGWARGLKECGYATDPKYPEKLISIIERYHLDDYDTGDRSARIRLEGDETLEHGAESAIAIEVAAEIARHAIVERNGLHCIVWRSGDTVDGVAHEFGLSAGKLRKFNDMEKETVPREGTPVYLQEKPKSRYGDTPGEYVASEGETLWEVSQKCGIKVKSLEKLNDMGKHTILPPGMVVLLP